ncbi:MAG TPA: ribonuclease HI [Thermoanaerobaculia bacterium]|nr:ribonuclease HI [Thermoanaerobaculia bacterium]
MPEDAPNSLPSVVIYTDGGADPNPGPGGWGAILLHPESGKSQELSGGEPLSTNNRMELTAAIRALEALQRRCRVELFTDSRYLRQGITEWLPGWIARGWRRKSGELQNEDLWRRLAELAGRHQIRWHWVKGHAGDERNERADQLATAAIAEQRAAARSRRVPPNPFGRAPQAGPTGAALDTTAPPSAAPASDGEVFLRVSCAGGKGGWAALVRHAGRETSLSGAAAPTSAAALELQAAAAALDSLPRGLKVAVYSNSSNLRQGATIWLPAWRLRGWKTQEGKPVLHRALWERLGAAVAARQAAWPDPTDAELAEIEKLAPLARQAAESAAGPR